MRFEPAGLACFDARGRERVTPPRPPGAVGTAPGSTWVGDRSLIATGAVWTP